MAHDENLAQRIRGLFDDQPSLREVKMFGGLAFMVDDRMICTASAGDGALLVRVSPDEDPQLLSKPGAHRGQMGKGRTKHSTWQRSHACPWIPAPAPTSNAAAPKDEHPERIRRCLKRYLARNIYRKLNTAAANCTRALLDRHRRFNGLIELHRRIARDFRNRDNYRLRCLLIPGGLDT